MRARARGGGVVGAWARGRRVGTWMALMVTVVAALCVVVMVMRARLLLPNGPMHTTVAAAAVRDADDMRAEVHVEGAAMVFRKSAHVHCPYTPVELDVSVLPQTPKRCNVPHFTRVDAATRALHVRCSDARDAWLVHGGARADEPLGDGEARVTMEREWQWVRCAHRTNLQVLLREDTAAHTRARERAAAHGSAVNVLVLMLDSVSASHFARSAPRTAQLLHDAGALRFDKFHAVRTWTDPNVVAMMSGLEFCADEHENVWGMSQECHHYTFPVYPGYRGWPPAVPTDDLSTPRPCAACLWAQQAARGYVTLFSSDERAYGESRLEYLFGVNREVPAAQRGFTHVQTEWARDLRDILRKDTRKPPPLHCVGARESYHYQFDYVKQFWQTYSDVPRFAYVLSNFNHDDLSALAHMDDDLHDFVAWVLTHADDTMLVLWGDHGAHGYTGLGGVSVQAAQAEHRLPVLWMHVPPHVRTDALARNTAHLTTAFDVHNTLVHVLQGHETTSPWARSLLSPLPARRSCDDANVAFSCVCGNTHEPNILPRIETV